MTARPTSEPTAASPESDGPPPAKRAPSQRGRLASLGVTALVAAVVAAGTTALIDRSSVAETSTSPVVTAAGAGDASWSAVAAAVGPSVVSITVTGDSGVGQGSGVVWDADGRVVTNNHVVAGAGRNASVNVTLSDGHTYAAEVTGADATTDLAVVTVKAPGAALVPLTRGDSASLKVGAPVMAIGNPLGLSGTVTTGIVSALNRPVSAGDGTVDSGMPAVTNAIQTSAPINPGNSGGALVDASGRLVGINSSIATLGGGGGSAQSGSIGIGFAIPIHEVVGVAGQLIATGSVRHAYLGIQTRDTSVQQGDSSISGALVTSLVAGGPADKGGLQTDDVITGVDGTSVSGAEGLIGTIRGMAVGQQVTLAVLRGSRPTSVQITLDAAPSL